MDSLGLWLGLVALALALAAGLGLRDRRLALLPLSLGLLLAPVLIAGDNWDTERLVELRESPELLAAAGLAGAAAVAAAVALLLRHPRWLPLALVAVLPFRIPIDLAGSSTNLLLPLYLILLAGLIAAWLRPERMLPERFAPRGPLWAAIGPLLGLGVVVYALQAGYADDLSTAVENLCFFFAPFAALFVLLSAAPWDRSLLRAVVGVLAAVALTVAAVAFFQLGTGELFWNEKVIDGNQAHPYFRVNSLFFDPNIMGRYLALTMVALAAVASWGSRADGSRALVVFVVLLAALVVSYSQTSLLALLAGLLVLVLAHWGLTRAVAATIAVAGLLLVAVLGLGGGGLTAETTGRTGLVSGGLEIAADRPLVGFGSGSFGEQFEQRFGGGDGIAVESHTQPITVAAEQGLVGLIPYAALLVVAVLALWRAAGIGRAPARDRIAATLLALLGAMLVHSIGYAAFFSDPITWVLLAMPAALPALAPGAAPAPRPDRSPGRRGAALSGAEASA
jgi:O-antigen ligase